MFFPILISPGANLKIFYTERQERQQRERITKKELSCIMEVMTQIPCASRDTGSFDAAKPEMSLRISVSPDERWTLNALFIG